MLKKISPCLYLLATFILSACTIREQSAPTLTHQVIQPEYQTSIPTSIRVVDTVTPIGDVTTTEIPNAHEPLSPAYKPQAWTVYPISLITANIDLDWDTSEAETLDFTIFDMVADQAGDMWLATSYGPIYYGGDTWQPVLNKKRAGHHVEIAPDGSVWFTLESGGIYRYHNDQVELVLDLAYEPLMGASPDGNIWADFEGEFQFWDAPSWENYASTSALPFRAANWPVFDHQGHLYVWGRGDKEQKNKEGDRYGALAYYDGTTWVVYDQKEQYDLPYSPDEPFVAWPLLVDEQNRVWFYLWWIGLYSFQNGEFTYHTTNYEFTYYHPSQIVVDHTGTIWLGATGFDRNLLKYIPGSAGFQTLDGSFDLLAGENLLPFEKVFALYVDTNNDLWIATELGIYVFDLDA